jgi:HSP20 family molecular chaperone IbpA
MSKLPVQRQSRSLLPELSELFSGFPPFAALRPIFDSRTMRIEDEITDGRYEVRAELPGIDPAEDLAITVRDGQLTIKAERAEKKAVNGRSEFSYGSFIRSISLPAEASEDEITASYGKGILTVSVPISEPEARRVEVESTETDVQVEPDVASEHPADEHPADEHPTGAAPE